MARKPRRRGRRRRRRGGRAPQVGLALAVPRGDITTGHMSSTASIPSGSPANPVNGWLFELPVDPRTNSSIRAAIGNAAYFRVTRIAIMTMPANADATAIAAISNADRAAPVSSGTYADILNHLEDVVYKVKGAKGVPVRLNRSFNNLPWCRVRSSGDEAEPTISIVGAWLSPNACQDSGKVWYSIDIQCYGTA